jgi:hypothetical protein
LRWLVGEHCELQPIRSRSPREDCCLCHTVLAAANKCSAQSNKSRTGREATKKRESSVSYRRRGMTKEEQVVGLIFQVTMWAYIVAAAAYVVIG